MVGAGRPPLRFSTIFCPRSNKIESHRGHGVIIEGTFTTTADGILRVRDMQGRLYVERPAPGDDAQHVARKLLREKCGYSPFHAPIRYPRSYH
jgi:hypothetical protein